MRLAAKLVNMWRNLLRRDRAERDLDAELASYVDMLTDENMRAGMSPEAARRAALLSAGGVEQVKERVRDAWPAAAASAFARDVRHSLRMFARAPGFTAAVIVSLALGVGGTTAIFSVLNAVLLRPLPYPEADRLHEVRIWWGDFSASLSPADLRALREHESTQVGGYFFPDDGFALVDRDGPSVVRGAVVTHDLPAVLGVRPLLGRAFDPAREVLEVLIGEALWRERFGAAGDVVGRTLQLDGETFTIVGVMPAGFNVPGQDDGAVWVKFEPRDPTRRGPFYLNTVVRASRGAPESTIAGQLTAHTMPLLREQFGVTDEWRYGVVALKETIVGDVRPTLRLLGWAVPLVLVIGILNFANLLLARGLTRRHEIGVRTALGAGRRRIAGQLLLEAALLGVMGGVAGIGVAWGALAIASSPASAVVPRMNDVRLDFSVVTFALVVGLGAGLLAGVLPAVRLPWSTLMIDLRERGRGSGPGFGYARARRLLVGSVVAVTLMVLVSAALLVKSLMKLQAVDPGFAGEGVLSFRIALPDDAYPDTATQKMAAFLAQLEVRLRALPGVSDVAFSSALPPDRLQLRNNYTVEGVTRETQGPSDVADWILASVGYFDALRIPIVRGRAFTPADRDGAPGVVVVNDVFARKHFPGVDPIGKRLKGGDWDPAAPWLTIVGVAGDVPYEGGIWQGAGATIYSAHAQNLWLSAPFVVVRTAGDPLALLPSARATVQELDRTLPLRDVATMRQRLHDSVAAPRLRGRLFVLLAAVALALAVTGIFGLLAYDVNQHRQDIAVRRALGAQTAAVITSVVRSGLQLVAFGVIAGVIGAVAAGRLLAGLLYGVTPGDAQVLIAASAALTGAALLACLLPALSAARIEPMKVLRQE